MDSTQHEKPKVEKNTEEKNSIPSLNLTSTPYEYSEEIDSMPNFISNEYLESLGLMLNNGKARFKLDEPVTTALSTNTMTMSNLGIDDEAETLSFVVLGKNSLDAIQASSLASYVDIQKKSMAVDYSSMISSLNANEVQLKLTELLQENVKLKETLKQNNLAMKQQFNTLAKWQEEVMKVHHNHKQKFAETREFINRLKKENNELKIKFSTLQTENTEHGFEAISKLDKDESYDNQVQCKEKIKLLIGELHMSQFNCTKLEKDVEYYKNIFNATNIQLEHAKQIVKQQAITIKKLELESAMESSSNCNKTSAKTIEHKKCSETCFAKDEEIARLKEDIALLVKKSECSPSPIQLHDLLLDWSSSQDRQKFTRNMNEYNHKLQDLTECFGAQIDRYAIVERCLKEIMNILEILDNDKLYLKFQTTENDSLFLSETPFLSYKDKLRDCHKELIDEQVKIITEKQVLIKSQNLFRKVLSDYNSILYELEVTIEENAKLNALKNNIVRENSRKQAELEKTMCDKQSLEEEKKIFNQEKDDLEGEKKLLESQKKILDMERESLHGEKKLLEQEKTSLSEEKTSLDHQSQLYENQEKAFQYEKKSMQVRYEQLLTETNNLRQNIQKKDVELTEFQQQVEQNTEEITLLKTQLTLYEEDFKQEKKVKESLMEEKSKLDVELQKQVEFNKQLQEDVRILQQGGKSTTTTPSSSRLTSEYSNEASTMPPCPKCETRFTDVQVLTEHIEKCLNLT